MLFMPDYLTSRIKKCPRKVLFYKIQQDALITNLRQFLYHFVRSLLRVAPAKAAQPGVFVCVQQGIPSSHACSKYCVPQATSPVQPGLPSQK